MEEPVSALAFQWILGDIRLFNQAYGVEKESFVSLEKEDYWFECRYERDVLTDETDRNGLIFSEEDVKNRTSRSYLQTQNGIYLVCEIFSIIERYRT